MTLTFATFVSLVWPFVIAGAAWGIAIWALSQPDEHSLLVKRLTTTSHGPSRCSHSPYTDRPPDAHTNTDSETPKS